MSTFSFHWPLSMSIVWFYVIFRYRLFASSRDSLCHRLVFCFFNEICLLYMINLIRFYLRLVARLFLKLLVFVIVFFLQFMRCSIFCVTILYKYVRMYMRVRVRVRVVTENSISRNTVKSDANVCCGTG